MNTAGIWMLLVLGVLILATGLPVWAVLLGVSTLFSLLGLATGVLDLNLLSAAPARIVGLLEHDLLQALPLYVFFGVLLQRLQVADAIFISLARGFRFTGAGVPLAALGTGALIAPMNGSVASSASLLARLVAPQLRHSPPAQATVLIAASATIGVVVPPSLVLILLGDAMLRAHTEASNLPGYAQTFAQAGQRIVNTQDLFNAALLPAAAILLGWMGWVCLASRNSPQNNEQKRLFAVVSIEKYAIALIAICVIVGLLACVFMGVLFAVEAAATGGCLLVLATLLTRSLSAAAWREVLRDALALSGALLALLVAATTFSLVFRGFGTDRWLADSLMSSTLSPVPVALLILLGIMACAWVLDAFEMIFVVIPIVAPALIAKLGDAQQAGVLLLLVLQLSFMLPPMGYAILMARARSGFEKVSSAKIFKAIGPFAAVVIAVIAMVFIAPGSIHTLDKAQAVGTELDKPSEADIVKQMQDMALQVPANSPADTAPALPGEAGLATEAQPASRKK